MTMWHGGLEKNKQCFSMQGLAPGLDLFIASTALVHGLTLVTHNTKDFAHVPGLTLEDWLVP